MGIRSGDGGELSMATQLTGGNWSATCLVLERAELADVVKVESRWAPVQVGEAIDTLEVEEDEEEGLRRRTYLHIQNFSRLRAFP